MEPRTTVHLLTLNEPAEMARDLHRHLAGRCTDPTARLTAAFRADSEHVRGYAQGTLPLVSFVDPDDLYEASAFGAQLSRCAGCLPTGRMGSHR